MFKVALLVIVAQQPQTVVYSHNSFMTLRDCNVAMFTGLTELHPRSDVSYRLTCQYVGGAVPLPPRRVKP